MAIQVSASEVKEMKSLYDRAKGQVKKLTESKKFAPIKRTAIGGAAAGVAGYAAGRLGPDKSKVLGVPLPIIASAALHGVAYAGYGGSYTQELHDAGDGPLFGYLYTKGLQLGDEALRKAGGGSSMGGESLSPEEAASMAHGG
ncbi:MAG: hypothetical protein Q8S13_09255 [Dehalococcoidia bacterium]|nr:hypothetical protein [Dehalococcoidia bacterium]